MKGVSELQLNKMAACVQRIWNLAALTEKGHAFLYQNLASDRWQTEGTPAVEFIQTK
jgi:hypothetical protein